MRRTLATTVALLTVVASLPGQAPRCAPFPALDSAQVLSDVFRLSADSMQGRRIGTTGNFKARDFIAARFDALGLGLVGGGRVQPFAAAPRRGGDSLRGFNVIGVIRGTSVPDSYLVVSAHFDHIGTAPGQCRAIGADSICNGADDNASGTVGLLALARHFMQQRPRHSILFAAFDGEEAGDLGSHAFVASAPVPLERILIDVNMDMIGRNVKNELFATGPAKYPELRPLIEAIAPCAGVTLTMGHDGEPGRDDWTGQSDQAAFHARGIPFVYFGEEDHPDYHRAGDQPERLQPAFLVSSARLVAEFVRRFDAAAPARR